MNRLSLTLAALPLLAGAATAGTKYEVRIIGKVEYNQVSSGFLGGVAANEAVTLSFRVDSDDFINSPNFPTRGYTIDKSTWLLQFQSGALGLQSPYSGFNPMFVLRNNDPAVDGFLVSDNVDNPFPVPLAQNGSFGAFALSFYATYGGALLPSLDIADAVGTYDFTGLTVFNYTIDDGPFNPVGLIFDKFTITEVLQGATTVYGCGVNPAGSMTVAGGSPTIGQSVDLGIDNPLGTQAAGSATGLFLGFAPPAGFPCGISIPGFGMGGLGAPGEVLLNPASPAFFLAGGPWLGAGTPTTISIGLPNSPALVGQKVFAQGLIIDPVAAQGVTVGLTDAAEILIGS
jgi:hypothetical protein